MLFTSLPACRSLAAVTSGISARNHLRKHPARGANIRAKNIAPMLLLSATAIVAVAVTVATTFAVTFPSTLNAQELLAREVLVQLSRNQSSQLCKLEPFTRCMAFTEKECLALSEKAIEQCLLPLPEKIIPSELDNDSIEACPRKVYEEAGFSDEKAKSCLAEATQ